MSGVLGDPPSSAAETAREEIPGIPFFRARFPSILPDSNEIGRFSASRLARPFPI
jgi:hypothetical protein